MTTELPEEVLELIIARCGKPLGVNRKWNTLSWRVTSRISVVDTVTDDNVIQLMSKAHGLEKLDLTGAYSLDWFVSTELCAYWQGTNLLDLL